MLKKQWTPASFHRTSAKVGRNKQHPLSKPSHDERTAITNVLYGEIAPEDLKEVLKDVTNTPRETNKLNRKLSKYTNRYTEMPVPTYQEPSYLGFSFGDT